MISKTSDPIVTTEWLKQRLGNPGLIVLDVRNNEEYQSGHIPGAVNVPFAAWTTTRNGLDLEIPETADLFKTIGSAGIKADSRVIVVHKTDNPYRLADAARVADTLLYAGADGVSILDGGQDKWVREARQLSCDLVKPEATEFRGKPDVTMLVTKDYVWERLKTAVILDTRGAEVYFGLSKETNSARPGHIPGAKCLPAPWAWNADGTYKNTDELRKMAAGVAGEPGSQEIIVYCGVGGYTSTWWFLLTQVLGYNNVRFYDGSAQDWSRDDDLPMVRYKWE